MRVYSMKSRNPVLAALAIVVALGALAMLFFVGMILLAGLAIAGTLIGAGLVIRHKLGRGRTQLERSSSARARLDPAMEVHPDRELLPPRSSISDE